MVSRVLDKKTLGLNENMKKKKVNKKHSEEKSLAIIERKPDMVAITKLLNGDKELAIFFMKWIECDRNATKAYMELHPDIDYHSARTLASRLLTKVDISMVLEALGLGTDRYFKQLDEGLSAEKKMVVRKFKKGELVEEIDLTQPDHKTRRLYHEPLGKMLGLEKDKGNQTLNYFDFSKLGDAIAKSRQERGLQQ